MDTYDLAARTVTSPDGTVRPMRPDEIEQFGLDKPDDQPVPVTADPATVAALAAHVEAITTDPATVKAALNAMLAALTANITT